jgi:hypothetical protein
LFSNEFPMIRFLERNGYDVSYTTGVDSERYGSLLLNHDIFLSVGHDEYWSGPQRANVEAARDAGVNLAFFSGNEVYWKTRYESSQDGSNTAYRTLVCYKETWANTKLDPSAEWTGTWRDPRFSPPSNGGNPENALTGTAYVANSDDLALQVPAAQGKTRLWRNTSVATLTAGQTATLAQHTVGYESNEDLDNGFRPQGLIHLSTTVGPTPQYLTDFGNTLDARNTTHHLTLYRAPSGALVFSAGSIQWSWGLDDNHDGVALAADSRMQQATVNLFADMGVQPGTLMSGLAAASASTDAVAPTAAITSPAAGASFANGTQVTVTGTAVDTGAGIVAGVEFSTDGATWHPATGTTSWSYTFTALGTSSTQLRVRAIDDSANIGAQANRTISLTGAQSIFGTVVPATAAANDSRLVELGVRFTPATDGFINGVRFYKGTGNTGTHTGTLWTNSGTSLATGTFTGETATGWQTLTFASPVAVTGNTPYIATYRAPNGHYAADPWKFSYTDVGSAPLVANRSTTTARNGLYRYDGGFPTDSHNDTNYYVDVLFLPAANSPPSVVSQTPTAGAAEVALSGQLTATFSKAINPATLVFTLVKSGGSTVAGATSYDNGTKTATFAPSAALIAAQTYTATVQASDTNGNAMTAPATWSFATVVDPSVTRLFAVDAVPANPAANDSGAVELGVKFTPSVSGNVVGVRYYQGAGNTGTHIGNLWTTGGVLLARATFGSGTGTGWQSVIFATPVAVTAGTTYVASYFAPNGHYSYDPAFFLSPWTNGSMTAPSGANGVYSYSASTAFPANTYNSNNYWVDPLFVAGGTPPPAPDTYSVFLDVDTPANPNWTDTSAVELGMKFTTDVAGTVTTLRFYKGPLNTGTHVGSLWTASGQLLAQATYQNETASGWQTLTLSSPVSITPGTTYIVSYYAPVGRYAMDLSGLGAPYDRAPLHVPANGGAYKYATGGGFPDSTSGNRYSVDVVFDPA